MTHLQEGDALSDAVASALGALDDDAWDVAGARERVRARVAEHAAAQAGGVSIPARRPRRAFWSLSKAAGILLLTAAGASALPGSPVRRWLERRAAPAVERTAAPEPERVAAPESPLVGEAAAEEAGVRISALGGPLSVVLRGAAPRTEIRVTWVPGAEAAVFAPVGTRFTSGEGRVEAALVPGAVRVELPRGVVPVSLEVDGAILLRTTPAGLEVSGSVVERTDAGITFRVPAR